jgi:hypothetical protein
VFFFETGSCQGLQKKRMRMLWTKCDGVVAGGEVTVLVLRFQACSGWSCALCTGQTFPEVGSLGSSNRSDKPICWLSDQVCLKVILSHFPGEWLLELLPNGESCHSSAY